MTILRYSRQSTNALSRMNSKQAQKIRRKLKMVAANCETGLDIKRLRGTRAFRLRIGKYRAEYFFDSTGQVMYISKVGSRGDFYK